MSNAIKTVLSYIKKHLILVVILAVGWLVNLSFFFPIRGNLGHDVYWHLALIEVAFKTFPFQMPILSGASLSGYNYLSDFFMYIIMKLGIPSLYVYFIVIPFIYVISLTFLVIYFGIRQNKSIHYVAPLTFFVFLATPFSYLLSLYKRGTIFFGFNYPTAMQSSTALTNLSYALTIPIVLTVLIIFQEKKRTVWQSFLLSVLVGLAFGLKFYGGVIVLCLVGIHEILLLLKNKNIRNFTVLIGSGVFFIGLSIVLFYNPFSSVKKAGIFGFAPLAIPHNLIEDPDGLYIRQFVLARYYLVSLQKFSPRLITIEGITLIIYLIYNFGTRVIGLLYLAKQFLQKKFAIFELSLLATVFISILLTVTLVQRGGDWWNTVQFFGYGLFLFNFFAASTCYELFRRYKKAAVIIIAVIILMTLPLDMELIIRAVERLGKPYDISKEEITALAFLKTQKNNGAVFALPVFNSLSNVPARSGKPVFFADETVISNLGIDYEARKAMLKDIININIETLPVRYFYLIKYDTDYKTLFFKIQNSNNIRKIYENSQVIIFEKH